MATSSGEEHSLYFLLGTSFEEQCMELVIFSSCMSDVESNNSEQAVENINTNVPVQRRKRALQQVCTKQERKIVVGWMIEDARLSGEAYVISCDVWQFPLYFCSANV